MGASLRKNEIVKLSPNEIDKKIVELERSMLELRSEGNGSKVKSVKKTIARLLTAKTIKSGKSIQIDRTASSVKLKKN